MEQDQSLLELRKEHDYMNLEGFQKAFFPDRSRYAISKRLSVLKRAGKQKASLGNSPLADRSNNRRRQPSTIEYIYSDDESQAMSLESRSDAEDAGGEYGRQQNSPGFRRFPSLRRRIYAAQRFHTRIRQTASNANTVVDVGDNTNNQNHRNNTQISIFSSRSSWMDLKDEDILQMFNQAKKCVAERRRTET
ncbi:hypothetical protein ACJ73_05607 [Blastomyces percursus]|uniref:Uncharacterized protein n=1 Tax=Blastomyces percursus TaxID=1658174 RepID=A0A1J9Q327_9EURO|nr:hypothetical protein ACJ73_05607 [Blastomyces percursus]